MGTHVPQRPEVDRLDEHVTEDPKLDYKAAGVDIEAGNEAVRRIASHARKTHTPAVLTGLGAFGSLFSLREAIVGMHHPVMVQSTDGVGTKTLVAAMAGRYEDLGRDLVAAVAGDIAVMGARPLTFLDYLGLHRMDPAIVEELVRGMSAACAEAGIALVGGETAEMPDVYAPGDLDVVGFITGVVEREKLITGAEIVAGDALYAINSSGLHTNGWTLARKLLFERGGYGVQDTPEELGGATLTDVLLAPHTNYVMPIRALLECEPAFTIKGMAHITGGGLVENPPRMLPNGLGASIDLSTWTPQPVFILLKRLGRLDDLEMLRTFNMGVGLVLAAAPGLQSQLAAALAPFPHLHVWEFGRVEDTPGMRFERRM